MKVIQERSLGMPQNYSGLRQVAMFRKKSGYRSTWVCVGNRSVQERGHFGFFCWYGKWFIVLERMLNNTLFNHLTVITISSATGVNSMARMCDAEKGRVYTSSTRLLWTLPNAAVQNFNPTYKLWLRFNHLYPMCSQVLSFWPYLQTKPHRIISF